MFGLRIVRQSKLDEKELAHLVNTLGEMLKIPSMLVFELREMMERGRRGMFDDSRIIDFKLSMLENYIEIYMNNKFSLLSTQINIQQELEEFRLLKNSLVSLYLDADDNGNDIDPEWIESISNATRLIVEKIEKLIRFDIQRISAGSDFIKDYNRHIKRLNKMPIFVRINKDILKQQLTEMRNKSVKNKAVEKKGSKKK